MNLEITSTPVIVQVNDQFPIQVEIATSGIPGAPIKWLGTFADLAAFLIAYPVPAVNMAYRDESLKQALVYNGVVWGEMVQDGADASFPGSISGTTNQVNVSANTNSVGENVTISLPQNIDTMASPQFVGTNLSGLTPSELVATDGTKNLSSLPTATYPNLTELSYSKGVTSAIQTQINTAESQIGTKANDNAVVHLAGTETVTGNKTFSGTVTTSALTASEILATDGSKNVQALDTATYPSLTELSYGKGVTSAIQTQLGTKAVDSTVVHLAGTETVTGNKTFSGTVTTSALTASEILATDGSKNVQALDTATYPSLTELSYGKGVTSAIQTQLGTKAVDSTVVHLAGTETVTGNKTFSGTVTTSALTASEILATDGSKNVQALDTATYPSLTELSYGKGVTSAIQTQLGTKAVDSTVVHLAGTETVTGNKTFSGTVTTSALTASEILATDGSKNVQALDTATYPSLTELSYGKGVTSAIQTQLNGKQASLGFTPENVANKSTDTTLGGISPSNTFYPSQAAVKSYADALIAANNALVYKGAIDASGNPNYPAASVGWMYVISVAGKIGGASGVLVDAGDMVICITANAGGTQAAVGADFNIIERNITGEVFGPGSSVSGNIPLWNNTAGTLLKDSGVSVVTSLGSDNTTVPTSDAVNTGLSAKANDNAVVHLAGTETVTGNKTFSGTVTTSALTASEILATDGSKNVQALDTATYPSLTELSYGKGVTSAIQTQINGKQASLTGSISGTANQVNVSSNSNSVASNITLSTPQNIDSGASPTFVDATLSGLTAGNVIPSSKSVDATLQATDNIFTIKQDPTGFDFPNNVIVSYSSVTQEITLSGSTWQGYWRGQKVTALSSGTGYTSPAHTNTVGHMYWLYYNGSTFSWSTDTYPGTNELLIAGVYYYSQAKFAFRECHGLMDWDVHQECHSTIGTYNTGGGVLSGYTLASATAANRRPVVSSAVIKDEDLSTTIPAIATNSYTQFYLTSTTTDNYNLAATDIVPLSTNHPYYNQFTGGAWQQTLMANSSYQTIWLLAMPVTSDSGSQSYSFTWVQGQVNNTVLATEQALLPSSVNLGNLATAQEFIFVAKAIINYTPGGGGDWTITEVDVLTGTKLSQGTLPNGTFLSSVTTGSSLSGVGTVSSPLVVAFDTTASNIKVDGTQSAGSSGLAPNSDHVHPTDTSRVSTATTVNGHALSSNVVVSASDITTGTLPSAQLPAVVYASRRPQGLLFTRVSTTSFSIGPGVTSDSTFSDTMVLTTTLTKTTSTWVAGTAAGGLDTGSIAASTWYYVYEIKNTTNGNVDIIFSASSSSPSLPSGFTLYKLIDAVQTDGSVHFISTIAYIDGTHVYASPTLDVSSTSLTTAKSTFTVTTVPAVPHDTLFNMYAYSAGGDYKVNCYGDNNITDQAPTGDTSTDVVAIFGGGSSAKMIMHPVIYMTGQSIYARSNISSTNLSMSVFSWNIRPYV